MRGIGFDLDAQAAFLEQELSDALREFAPDETVDANYRYGVNNDSLALPDARLLYALIRRLRPRSIVELGSGQTSRVIAQACRVNAADGHESTYRAFDPFPTSIDVRSSRPHRPGARRRPDRSRPGLHRSHQRRHFVRRHHSYRQSSVVR